MPVIAKPLKGAVAIQEKSWIASHALAMTVFFTTEDAECFQVEFFPPVLRISALKKLGIPAFAGMTRACPLVTSFNHQDTKVFMHCHPE